jgi:hypothetical protein
MLQLLLHRVSVHQPSGKGLTSEILLQESKIILIADKAIAIQVDRLEKTLQMSRVSLELEKGKSVIDGLHKFLLIHLPLRSAGVHLLTMKSLNGDLAEVLLHTEIYQLIVFDDAIVIVIVPENVFNKVMYLRFSLVHDVY